MDLVIKGNSYKLPIFLPDATHASIKGLDLIDTALAGIRGVVVNTYHLLNDNVVDIIEKAGGVKNFMNFSGLVITDSGGFQAMSLVRKITGLGKLTDNGVVFKDYRSGALIELTPEKCIEIQFKLGADIIMALDDCTDPSETQEEQEISVNRTIAWAKRCKSTYDRMVLNLKTKEKPLIFGIVQGGNIKQLRQKCAEGLVDLNFDGYAYGGWPMMNGYLLRDILEFTASLMPDDKPKYAMGVGKPADMHYCLDMGYNMFDCVIPTRDARHGRLYLGNGTQSLDISKSIYTYDNGPIESTCLCYTCKNFSKAYLKHLYKVKEPVYFKLATIHNLAVFGNSIKNTS